MSRGGRPLTELGPGDFFGELALLDSNSRRDASVVADGPMAVFVVGRREFTALLQSAPALMLNVLKGMARRLHDVDAHA